MPSVERNCPRCFGKLSIDINERLQEDPASGEPDVVARPRQSVWQNPFRWFLPPDISNEEAAVEADEWANLYSPAGQGDNYKYLVEYAEKRFDYFMDAIAEADKKADELTKMIITFAAAVSYLLANYLMKTSQIPGQSLPFGGSGIVLLSVSLVLAVSVRIPAKLKTPAVTRVYLEASDNLPEIVGITQIHGSVAASYHAASTAAQIINEWKARRLVLANQWFIGSVLMLLLFIYLAIPTPKT